MRIWIQGSKIKWEKFNRKISVFNKSFTQISINKRTTANLFNFFNSYFCSSSAVFTAGTGIGFTSAFYLLYTGTGTGIRLFRYAITGIRLAISGYLNPAGYRISKTGGLWGPKSGQPEIRYIHTTFEERNIFLLRELNWNRTHQWWWRRCGNKEKLAFHALQTTRLTYGPWCLL